jgi:hypothetical protein
MNNQNTTNLILELGAKAQQDYFKGSDAEIALNRSEEMLAELKAPVWISYRQASRCLGVADQVILEFVAQGQLKANDSATMIELGSVVARLREFFCSVN